MHCGHGRSEYAASSSRVWYRSVYKTELAWPRSSRRLVQNDSRHTSRFRPSHSDVSCRVLISPLALCICGAARRGAMRCGAAQEAGAERAGTLSLAGARLASTGDEGAAANVRPCHHTPCCHWRASCSAERRGDEGHPREMLGDSSAESLSSREGAAACSGQ